MGTVRVLTFGLWQPYEEGVGIVDDADDPEDEDDKHVANDDSWTDGKSAWHYGEIALEVDLKVCSGLAI